ncbi:MAG: ATP-dependent DNA helicase RecQ [Rubricoccaceae bacterium]
MPTTNITDSALDALQRVWGYEAFRSGQAEAITAVMSGRDVLAVLPTGGGKSLIYQVPAIATNGLVLVVSPLVALMHDQVEALRRRGISATSVHAGLSIRGQDQLWTDAEYGRYRVVYLTPERFQTELFRARAARLPVSLLAIDEAHCISEWGHDFRPAYRQLADARSLLSGANGERVPIAAVTATATPEARRDIVAQLELVDPDVIVRGFDRPNLIWSVHPVENKEKQVADVFAGVPGSGLVYAGTRRGTEMWAQRLRQLDISAEAYHAGLPAQERQDVQSRWLAGDTRVIAATSAFGMGIDKPDVRAVVHVALPLTLESYYQEAGRAGRDGERAYAALVIGPTDDRLPRSLIASSHPTAEQLQAVYKAAGSLSQLAVGSEPNKPIPLSVERLASVAQAPASIARAAIERIEALGVWRVSPRQEGTVQLKVESRARLAEAQASAPPPLAAFLDGLQRHLPPAVYGAWTSVRLDRLANSLGLAHERVHHGFAYLAQRGILESVEPRNELAVDWLQPRSERLVVDGNDLNRSRRHALSRLDDLLAYVDGIGCRRQHLLAYFGEPSPARCGRCDICLGRHRPDVVMPEDEPLLRRILDHVNQGDPVSIWLEGVSPRKRNGLVDWLANEGLIRLSDPLNETFELTPKGLRAMPKTR